MRKGFIAGLLVGGLVGAYYGMQMTVREKSELRGMAMKFASRGKQAIHQFGDSADGLKEAAQEILE
ncbi:MAG: hypothetical protein FD169_444 [Bacillota bacterium]|nr:MAG: hypothetical protein FD169_444 [Bacillota bacterium]